MVRWRRFGQASGYLAFTAASLLPLYFYSRSDRVPPSDKALVSVLVSGPLQRVPVPVRLHLGSPMRACV